MKRKDVQLIEEIRDYLDEHLYQEHSIADLCRQFNLNREKLQSGFHELANTTVHAYIVRQRVDLSVEHRTRPLEGPRLHLCFALSVNLCRRRMKQLIATHQRGGRCAVVYEVVDFSFRPGHGEYPLIGDGFESDQRVAVIRKLAVEKTFASP